MSVDGLRSPNEGGGGSPRPFLVVAFWAGFVLAENRGDTVQGLKSSEAFLSCIRAEVSELHANVYWRRSSFSSEKAFTASRERGKMIATGTVAVRPCVTRTTVACGVNVGRDLGHTPV